MKRVIMLCFCTILLCSCGTDTKKDVKVVQEVKCTEAMKLVDEGAILIDVRTIAEYSSGHLDGAKNIPVEVIAEQIESEISDKDTKIVVYCRSGNRSATAGQTLIDMGYTNVYDLGAMNNCAE